MDRRAAVLMERLATAADDIADEITEATMREVPAFEAMSDPGLREEIRALAGQHVRAFTLAARTGSLPPAEVLAAARERAVMRARQMVPLSAMLHSHLIAQRIISAALTNAASHDATSRGTALELRGGRATESAPELAALPAPQDRRADRAGPDADERPAGIAGGVAAHARRGTTQAPRCVHAGPGEPAIAPLRVS